MDQPGDEKPQAVLAHMPPHIKQKIGQSLDYFDTISLRNLSWNFRQTIGPPRISAVVKVIVKENEVRLMFECNDHRLNKKKKYSKNKVRTIYKRDGYKQDVTVQGEEDPVEMMIQDFKSLLNTPKLTLCHLAVYLKKSEEIGIMPRIRHLLSNLEPRLKTRRLFIRIGRPEDVLGILPYLNPDVLTELHIETDGLMALYSIGDLALNRFRNIERLYLQHLRNILPVESWWNVPFVGFQMAENSSWTELLGQLPRILQHFRQCHTFIDCFLVFPCTVLDIKNAIGDIGQWEAALLGFYICHLPADGSNLGIYCEIGDGAVHFSRAEPRRRTGR